MGEKEPEVAPQPQPAAKKGNFTRGNPYRWALGNSGRPKGSVDRKNKLSEAYGQMLEQSVVDGTMTNADAIALRMIHIALTGKPGAAVIAAKELADRSEGKPTQQIQVSQVVDERTVQRLVEIGELLAGRLPKPALPVLTAKFVEKKD